MTSISNDLKHNIRIALEEITAQEHNSPRKQEVRDMSGRLVLACPYCGDSHSDDSKKRGNLYWDTLQYHCYNCSKHTNVHLMLKDFNVSMHNIEDTFDVIDYIKSKEREVKRVDTVRPAIFTKANELAIPLQEFKNGFSAREIEPGEWIWLKLKERLLHSKYDEFLYSERDNKLWILNRTPSGNILAVQSRRMKGKGSRYLTYDLPKLYEELGKKLEIDSDEKLKISKLSTLFGIMQVNFQRTVTLFEGPLDAKFMQNSIALATAGRSTDEFDEMETVRYMFDNDETGKKKMAEKLKKGRPVFMWSKFIDEMKLDKYNIKDLNDLIKVCYSNKLDAYKRLDDYFTASQLDLWYV